MTAAPTATIPAGCADFDADYDRIGETFGLGDPVTLYWTAAAGALGYRIEIYDTDGEALHVEHLGGSATSYAIPAEVLEVPELALQINDVVLFGWELTPIDAQRVQFCPPVGGELIAIEGTGSDDAGSTE
jgi:hypothetical protein